MQLLGLMTDFAWLLVTELVDIGCQIQDESEESVRNNLPEAVGILSRAIQERARERRNGVFTLL
jgi:urease gamma subunit